MKNLVIYGNERIPLEEAIKRAVKHNANNPVQPAVYPYEYDPTGSVARSRVTGRVK